MDEKKINRETFIFYTSFHEAISELPRSEDRLAVYEAICAYSLHGELLNLTGTPKAFFMLIKPQLDANIRKRENGEKGGRPPKKGPETKPNENRRETEPEPGHNLIGTEPEPNVNANVNTKENRNRKENVNANDLSVCADAEKERRWRGVLEIFFFRGFADPQSELRRFFAHYEKTGWRDSHDKPIRKISAAAELWEQQKQRGGARQGLPAQFLQAWRRVYEEYGRHDPDKGWLLLEVSGIELREGAMRLQVSQALNDLLCAHREVFLDIYNRHFTHTFSTKVKRT